MTKRPQFFADPARYPYKPSPPALFLGVDPEKLRPVGFPLERMALTIAGAGAGKGACLLIPNALRWVDNLLVVDPKGEVAAATWQAREALGQSVHVLDPFHVADVPDRLRASFNPLAAIDPASLTAREDMKVIADGLVKRSDPKHEEWYEGAVSILSGLIAYVMEYAPPEHRTLNAVRALLVQPNEVKDASGSLVGGLYHDAQKMLEGRAFGGLARAAGVTVMTAIEADKGMEKDFLGGARRATEWLDSDAMSAALGASSFALSDLKRGKVSVFLVLPPQYLGPQGAFLRLLVRSAINAMMADGIKGEGRCLMLLDEFYSLGRLDIVAQAAGLMRAYKLHLWPFLQDMAQLHSLYGQMAETFLSNADVVTFFGNSDIGTLEYVSRLVGAVDPREVGDAPTMGSGINPITGATVGAIMGGNSHRQHERTTGAIIGGAVGLIGSALHDLSTRAAQAEVNEYQKKAMKVGRARLAPDEIKALTGKPQGAAVAAGLLAFLRTGEILHLRPAPYFDERLNKFVDLGTRLNVKRADSPTKKLGRKWGPLDFAAGVVAFLLMSSALGPLSQPDTVPQDQWSFLYTVWGSLSALLVGLIVLIRKTR